MVYCLARPCAFIGSKSKLLCFSWFNFHWPLRIAVGYHNDHLQNSPLNYSDHENDMHKRICIFYGGIIVKCLTKLIDWRRLSDSIEWSLPFDNFELAVIPR